MKDIDEIYSARGRKVVHVALRTERPDRASLVGRSLGPTGNLRAPVLRVGRTLVVGFDEDTYKRVLGVR